MKKKIIHVSSCPLLRVGVAACLAESAEFEVVVGAQSRADALAGLSAEPEIILLDPKVDPCGSVALIREIAARSPARILLFGDPPAADDLAAAAKAGVAGFLSSTAEVRTLLTVLRQIAAGEEYWDLLAAGALLSAQQRQFLSAREREVLAGIAAGLSSERIAKKLGTATSTVNKQVATLRVKLGARNRSQALMLAMQYGALEQPPGNGAAAGADARRSDPPEPGTSGATEPPAPTAGA